MSRVLTLWIAFLLVWAFSLLVYGAVAPWAVAVTALALVALNLAAAFLFPNPFHLSRYAQWFLVAVAAVFILQLLPLFPFLFPYTTRLRELHGVGWFWPGTADTFLTLRSLVQVSTYVLSALLVLRLRQAGLGASHVAIGLCAVLGLEALYGLIQTFAGFETIPFFGERIAKDSASGTLVNRNSFGGLMAMGIAVASGLALSRLSKRFEAGVGWLLLVGLFVVGLVLSKSRGGAVAAGVGLLLIPFLYRSRTAFIGAAAVLVVGGIAVMMSAPAELMERFEETSPVEPSAAQRIEFWKRGAEAWLNQPVLGYGIGSVPEAYHPFQKVGLVGQVQHLHSEYINALFEGGIVWLLILFVGLKMWLYRMLRGAQAFGGSRRALGAGAAGAVAAIAVHSIFDFDLRITAVGLMFGALIGFGVSALKTGYIFPRWGWIGTSAGSALAAIVLLAVPLDANEKLNDPATALGLSPYNYRAAWILARTGDDVERFRNAAEIFPAHPELQRDIGVRLWKRGKRDEAALCFRRAFEARPETVPEVMGQIWDPKERFDPMVQGVPHAAAELAAFLVGRARWEEAQDLFGRAEAPPEAYDRYADRLKAMGAWWVEAWVREERLKKASNAKAYIAAATAWEQLEAWDLALKKADTLTTIAPSGEAYALRARILGKSGRGLESVQEWTRALQLDPGRLGYRVERAKACEREELWSEAVAEYKRVVAVRPDEREVVMGLARSLAGAGNSPGAVRLLEEFLRRNRKDDRAKTLLDSLK